MNSNGLTIAGSVALVTGSNRGIGRHYVQQLLERGASKVYATARDPRTIDLPGATILPLDITDPASVAAAAAAAPDVQLLVNNAGVTMMENLVDGDLDRIRLEIDTNVYGTLSMVRAFAPVLAANGGGAILNMLSRLSWIAHAGAGGYAVSKAAQWNLTNAIRLELARQGTLVTGVLLSATDTDMMAGWDIPKNDPADVVGQSPRRCRGRRAGGRRRRGHRRGEGGACRRPGRALRAACLPPLPSAAAAGRHLTRVTVITPSLKNPSPPSCTPPLTGWGAALGRQLELGRGDAEPGRGRAGRGSAAGRTRPTTDSRRWRSRGCGRSAI